MNSPLLEEMLLDDFYGAGDYPDARVEREVEDRLVRAAEALATFSDPYLKALADHELLTVDDAKVLIYTRVLKRVFPREPYLREIEPAIERLRKDADRGEIDLPCRPRALVDWARRTGVSFPKAFVDAVEAQASGAPIREESRRKARQRDDTGVHFELQKEAEALAREWKSQKKKPLKQSIAVELAKRHGMDPA